MNKHSRSQLAWLLPILALSPLALAAKGCNNAGVVGDDCPTASDCPSGTAGKGSAGQSGNPGSKVCGGLLGTSCASDQYCDFPSSAQCGAADQTGQCVTKPEACDLVYAPVCGCDDKTYGSDCSAHGAGVSVAYNGECRPGSGSGNGSGGDSGSGSGSGGGSTGGSASSGFCGGIAAVQCPKDQYCDFPLTTRCGATDQGGSCKPIPPGCDKKAEPVCGCDQKTYGNACMAALSGISIAAQGECTATGKACGEVGGCAKDEYCNYPPESKCGIADGPGVYTKIPVNVGCIELYAPVCGCDGHTYGNDCSASLAGMSIAAKGECEKPMGEVCGGITGAGCQDGYFCDFPEDAPCGSGDQTGVCVVNPKNCNFVERPVCGCDGKKYSNECTAQSLGTDGSDNVSCL